jgi:hypothetical protein
MSRPKVAKPSDNGQPGGPVLETQEELDARHLKEAVENPGVPEIPDEPLTAGPVPVLEIPQEDLTPDAAEGGEPLPADPALMTVSVGRPGPTTFVRVYPGRTLRTVLLPYKRKRDDSPDYHWVTPELREPLQRHLRQVNVYLLAEAAEDGESFLWIVPESDFSPYHNGMARVLAMGAEYIRTHLFLFYMKDTGSRKKCCDLEQRLIQPVDVEPLLPSRSVGALLPEALKADRLIRDTSHPVYVNLTSGRRLP